MAEIISKVDLNIMEEDLSKRNLNTKKFVEPFIDNKRKAVIRKYKENVHKLIEDEEKINNVEFEEEEITEYLNQS